VELHSCAMFLALRKSVDFWNASRLHPFVLAMGATCRRRWIWSIGRM